MTMVDAKLLAQERSTSLVEQNTRPNAIAATSLHQHLTRLRKRGAHLPVLEMRLKTAVALGDTSACTTTLHNTRPDLKRLLLLSRLEAPRP